MNRSRLTAMRYKGKAANLLCQPARCLTRTAGRCAGCSLSLFFQNGCGLQAFAFFAWQSRLCSAALSSLR